MLDVIYCCPQLLSLVFPLLFQFARLYIIYTKCYAYLIHLLFIEFTMYFLFGQWFCNTHYEGSFMFTICPFSSLMVQVCTQSECDGWLK